MPTRDTERPASRGTREACEIMDWLKWTCAGNGAEAMRRCGGF